MRDATFQRGGGRRILHAACGLLLGLISTGVTPGCRQPTDITQPHRHPSKADRKAHESTIDFRLADCPALKAVAYQNGRQANMCAIIEIVGGGVACIDYDLDGHDDLFFPGGGSLDPQRRIVSGVASVLLRGGPDWSFENVTAAAGVTVDDMYTHGAAAADYNHDGFVDLLVYGYRGVRLLRNQGDGTFHDATREAGLTNAPWTTAAAWCDLDEDGTLDLYLGSYVAWDFDTHRVCRARGNQPEVCSPNAFEGSSDALYRGAPDGTFVDDSQQLVAQLKGKALGALAARFEAGEEMGIYVANDITPNLLFRQRKGSQLEEVGVASGVAVDGMGSVNGSMGITLLDLDGNQRFDLLVNNFEHEQIAFYRNEGSSLFRFASRDMGLSTLDARVVGFGIVAADFDCDGDEDAMLTSGNVYYHPDSGDIRQPPVLLEHTREHQLQRIMPSCEFFHRRNVGRGLAVADFDDDGDLDVIVTYLFDPPQILENVSPTQNSWLRMRLIGRESTRTPFGAIVTVKLGEKVMARQLYSGGSYLSQSQQELFFGWEGADEVDVKVQWPSGRVTNLPRVKPRQQLVLVEP